MSLLSRFSVLALASVSAAGLPGIAYGQFSERPPTPRPDRFGVRTADAHPESELLQQLAFDYSPAATHYRIKLLKLWVEPFHKKYFPVYFLSNPAALIPKDKDSVTLTARELLSQFGGLLNVASARNFYAPGGIPDNVGIQGEIRAAGKLVEFPPGSSNEHATTLVGQIGGTGSWLMRLWNDIPDKTTSRPDTLSQAGTFTINLRVAGNFLGGNRYRSMFSDGAGNTPPVAVGALQADASLHLLDELILTGGYTYSTSSLIPSAGFGGFSLSRPPNKGRK